MRKYTLLLIVAGSLLNASVLISHRFLGTSDFVLGLLQGIGIGLLLLALINEWKYRLQRK